MQFLLSRSVVSAVRALRVAAPVALIMAAACAESQADPTGPGTQTPEAPINQIVTFGPLNASSTDTLVYFSFATGGLVAKTGDWDLAFRRYELRLNSPAVGGATSKNVLGLSLDNNKAATDAQVLAFTAAGTLSAFDQVRDAQVPADSLFQTDRLTENKQGYLNLSGVPSANSMVLPLPSCSCITSQLPWSAVITKVPPARRTASNTRSIEMSMASTATTEASMSPV
jgi:hypothetical protein